MEGTNCCLGQSVQVEGSSNAASLRARERRLKPCLPTPSTLSRGWWSELIPGLGPQPTSHHSHLSGQDLKDSWWVGSTKGEVHDSLSQLTAVLEEGVEALAHSLKEGYSIQLLTLAGSPHMVQLRSRAIKEPCKWPPTCAPQVQKGKLLKWEHVPEVTNSKKCKLFPCLGGGGCSLWSLDLVSKIFYLFNCCRCSNNRMIPGCRWLPARLAGCWEWNIQPIPLSKIKVTSSSTPKTASPPFTPVNQKPLVTTCQT